MARRLRSAVNRVVLGRGDGQIVVGVVALQAGDIGNAHAAGQERIFAVCLLPTAPAWIPEDIQVGRPEIEPAHDSNVALACILHVLDAAFNANLSRHGVNTRRIEGGGKADGLWILGNALVDHAMQRLAPPLVCRDLQPLNLRRIVLHLRGFFRQSHAMHQVGGAFLGRQFRIQVGRIGRILGGSRLGQCTGQQYACTRKHAVQNVLHADFHARLQKRLIGVDAPAVRARRCLPRSYGRTCRPVPRKITGGTIGKPIYPEKHTSPSGN